MSPRPTLGHVRKPALLEAAAAGIRERGLENLRLADVAERAGTSAPSVLYYFESKAELVSEALTSAEERFYEQLDEELEAIETAAARLRHVVESCSGEGDYDWILWMELWARAVRDPALAATRATLDRRWRATIATIVRFGQERGEFGEADPEEVALLLASLLDGLAVQLTLKDESVSPDRVRRMALAVAERELGAELDAGGKRGVEVGSG